MGLDLYAKIEPLLGFEEQKRRLHELFLKKVQALGIKRLLDIGCGSGAFLRMAKEAGIDAVGIDLSSAMVDKARSQGLDCRCVDLCQLKGRYEGAVAIFDVLNYIEPDKIQAFLQCVADVLEDGGFFLADINTLYGFEEVAQGSIWIDANDRFAALEAEFEDNKLLTKMVYFQEENGCFRKESGVIVQYYHDVTLLKQAGLSIIDIDFVELFGDRPDKALLTFQKG